jgi:hypothetical protein
MAAKKKDDWRARAGLATTSLTINMPGFTRSGYPPNSLVTGYTSGCGPAFGDAHALEIHQGFEPRETCADAGEYAVGKMLQTGNDEPTAPKPAKPAASVAKPTIDLMTAWQNASDECDNESVGGDKIGDKYPKACSAMQPLGEALDKRGCIAMDDDR